MKRKSWRGALAAAVLFATPLVTTTPLGAQVATCNGLAATAGVTSTPGSSSDVTVITGTSGNDVIIGTNGPDIIRGLKGSDTICGLDGNDLIIGGKGGDTIDAGRGNDTVNANRGADTVNGGNGHDRLNGNKGQDRLNGNNGNDIINGGNGADGLAGNGGNDSIQGGELNDTIDGGAGADQIAGNGGIDSCINRESIDSISSCESNQGTLASTSDATAVPNIPCTQESLYAHYNGQLGDEANSLGAAEDRLFDLINETRAICELDPLTVEPRAEGPAQTHSQEMLNTKDRGHPDGPSYQQLFSSGDSRRNWWFVHSNRWQLHLNSSVDDITTAGENVAFTWPQVDPARIHRNLIASGGHLCNILRPSFDGIGLGLTYFDTSANNGLIVTEIFTGDRNIEATNGSLFVLNNHADPTSGQINCWS